MLPVWGDIGDQRWQIWQQALPPVIIDLSGDDYFGRLQRWWRQRPDSLPGDRADMSILRENLRELRLALREALSAKPAISQEELLALLGGSAVAAAAPAAVKAWKALAMIEPTTAGAVAALFVPVGYAIVKVRRETVFARREAMFKPLLASIDQFRIRIPH